MVVGRLAPEVRKAVRVTGQLTGQRPRTLVPSKAAAKPVEQQAAGASNQNPTTGGAVPLPSPQITL